MTKLCYKLKGVNQLVLNVSWFIVHIVKRRITCILYHFL